MENHNIESIIKKGYINTNIVQLDLVLIREFHVPILTNFFYIDRKQIKKIYNKYILNFVSLLKIKKKKSRIKKKNKEKLKQIRPFIKEKEYDYLLFDQKEQFPLLNKSILFKDILYSIYRNEEYSRIEFKDHRYFKTVIVKESEFVYNNILPLTYFKQLLYTPKIIPEFTKEQGYQKITENYLMEEWNEQINYNKLILSALISKSFFNKNVKNIEIKKIYAILNKKIKNYIMNFANNSSYSLITSYKRKNYIKIAYKKRKKEISRDNFLLRYRRNFVKKTQINQIELERKRRQQEKEYDFYIQKINKKDYLFFQLIRRLNKTKYKKLLIPHLFNITFPDIFFSLKKSRNQKLKKKRKYYSKKKKYLKKNNFFFKKNEELKKNNFFFKKNEELNKNNFFLKKNEKLNQKNEELNKNNFFLKKNEKLYKKNEKFYKKNEKFYKKKDTLELINQYESIKKNELKKMMELMKENKWENKKKIIKKEKLKKKEQSKKNKQFFFKIKKKIVYLKKKIIELKIKITKLKKKKINFNNNLIFLLKKKLNRIFLIFKIYLKIKNKIKNIIKNKIKIKLNKKKEIELKKKKIELKKKKIMVQIIKKKLELDRLKEMKLNIKNLKTYNFFINEQLEMLFLSKLKQKEYFFNEKKNKILFIFSEKNILISRYFFFSSLSRFLYNLFICRLQKEEKQIINQNYNNTIILINSILSIIKQKNSFFDSFFCNFLRKNNIYKLKFKLNNQFQSYLNSPLDLYYFFFLKKFFFSYKKKKGFFFNINLKKNSFFFYLEKFIFYLFLNKTKFITFFSYFLFSFFNLFKKNLLFNSFFNFFVLKHKINYTSFNISSIFNKRYLFNIYNSYLINFISFFRERYSYSNQNIVVPLINIFEYDFLDQSFFRDTFYEVGRYTFDTDALYFLCKENSLIFKNKEKKTIRYVEKRLGKKETYNFGLLETVGQNYLTESYLIFNSQSKLSSYFSRETTYNTIVNTFSFFDKLNTYFFLIKKNADFSNYFNVRFLSIYAQFLKNIDYFKNKLFFFSYLTNIMSFFFFFKNFICNYFNFLFLFNNKINVLINKNKKKNLQIYYYPFNQMLLGKNDLYNYFIMNMFISNSIINYRPFYFINKKEHFFSFLKYLFNFQTHLNSNIFINYIKKIKLNFNIFFDFFFNKNTLYPITNVNFFFYLFLFFFFYKFNFLFHLFNISFFNVSSYTTISKNYYNYVKKNKIFFSFINYYKKILKTKKLLFSYKYNFFLLKKKKEIFNKFGYLTYRFTKYNVFLTFLYKNKMQYFKSAGMYEPNRKRRYQFYIVRKMFDPFINKWEKNFCKYKMDILYFNLYGKIRPTYKCLLMICKRIRFHRKRLIIHSLMLNTIRRYLLRIKNRLIRIEKEKISYNIFESLKKKESIHLNMTYKHNYCSPKLMIPLHYPLKYRFTYGVLKKRIKKNARGIKSKKKYGHKKR